MTLVFGTAHVSKKKNPVFQIYSKWKLYKILTAIIILIKKEVDMSALRSESTLLSRDLRIMQCRVMKD